MIESEEESVVDKLVGGVRKKSKYHMPYTLVIMRTNVFATALPSVLTKRMWTFTGAVII